MKAIIDEATYDYTDPATHAAKREALRREMVPSRELGDVPGRMLDPFGMDVETARAAMERYQELVRALLSPDDFQRVGKREFVKRSGFQKVANAYSLSTQILVKTVDRDDDGNAVRAAALVRATRPDGRFAEGDGACAVGEERFKSASGRAKVEHDLGATAVTRATNRAISNLVAYGSVSAEEASEADAPEPPAADLPRWAQPIEQAVVPEFAEALVDVLRAGGVPEPGLRTQEVGEAIFQACGGIPDAVCELGIALGVLVRSAQRKRAEAATPSGDTKAEQEGGER